MGKVTKHERKLQRSERSQLKGRMRSFLMFLPNMVLLLGRLLKDRRVPTAEKALFLAALVYFISPIDFIPDVFPFILLRLVNRTDATVVRQLWPGGGDIVALADSIAGIAPKFLPRRTARVLTSKVELAPAGKVLRSITNRDEPLVREVAADDKIHVDIRSRMAN
jgi:hypothetical protein